MLTKEICLVLGEIFENWRAARPAVRGLGSGHCCTGGFLSVLGGRYGLCERGVGLWRGCFRGELWGYKWDFRRCAGERGGAELVVRF